MSFCSLLGFFLILRKGKDFASVNNPLNNLLLNRYPHRWVFKVLIDLILGLRVDFIVFIIIFKAKNSILD